ncbi:MAG: hypothetical protein P4L90_06455 [Rhodopila sp.]|nr:hypothetical protein [Rhodopila sp.]
MADEESAKREVGRLQDEGPLGGAAEAAEPVIPPEPTLAAYYGSPSPRPGDWLKVVRGLAERRFKQEDVEAALEGLGSLDPDLRKTWNLAKQASPPAAVQRWVGDATRHLLAQNLKGTMIDPMGPASEQIGRIADRLAPELRSERRETRAKAENLLRLAIRHIMASRPDSNPGDILAILSAPLREGGRADARLARSELNELLPHLSIGEFRMLSLVHTFMGDRVSVAEKGHRAAEENASILSASLADKRDRLRAADEALALAKARNEELATEVEQLKAAIDDNQQVGAFSRADLTGRVRALLSGRIDPLLADAMDALEIDPPIIEVAKDRVETVRAIIRKDLGWLDESSG